MKGMQDSKKGHKKRLLFEKSTIYVWVLSNHRKVFKISSNCGILSKDLQMEILQREELPKLSMTQDLRKVFLTIEYYLKTFNKQRALRMGFNSNGLL